MYDLLKTLVAQLAMPLPVTLILLALGWLLAWRGARRLGLGAAALGLVLLFLASWAPVADRLLAPLEARYPALQALPEDPPLAGIVVLGGGWVSDVPWTSTGKLGDSSAIRLMEGVRLWRQRPELPLVVPSSRIDADGAEQEQVYAQAALELGDVEERLIIMERASDTGREARAVREALGEGARVVMVTSASHMPRAMQHFRRAGLEPLAAPTHYLAGRTRPDRFSYWVPSATQLHKTERAVYERLGQLVVSFEQ
ncbi:hypothetical protein FEI13_12660 [Halomonas urmiana]|uniref:DUF218 domain-containing protein n=1 Tax=Halomonas urmiana TaxID=490901 RepID=A0A5R8MH31_9GAMM|nr:ElyC/SanA/YdcF family protein [Halomonas urmiana]TLF48570.1 hypothetical protein FEI13_12660 [Halomonas urmiana]